MTNAIAMQAEIVGMRNVDVHKSAVLTLHIPQELAAKFVDQFGWPTKVDPIPVAIARMNIGQKIGQPEKPTKHTLEDTCPYTGNKIEKPKREMTLPQRVGMICQDENFQAFINERFADIVEHYDIDYPAEKIIAEIVRTQCEVDSRSQILPYTIYQKNWASLYNDFKSWLEKQS